MSFDVLAQLNWVAVIVGTVVYFTIGEVWFTPILFGRPWQRSIGWDPSRTAPQMNPVTYAVPAVLYLLASIATGMLAAATGSTTFGSGIVLGLVVAVGYALVVIANDAVFDPNKPEPVTWFVITGGYNLVGLLIVAVLVSVWH